MTHRGQSGSRRELIDDFIDRWHKAPSGELDGPLHEEMGWTWDEYALFVTELKMPPEREGAL